MLPSADDKVPDWDFMEMYMEQQKDELLFQVNHK